MFNFWIFDFVEQWARLNILIKLRRSLWFLLRISRCIFYHNSLQKIIHFRIIIPNLPARRVIVNFLKLVVPYNSDEILHVFPSAMIKDEFHQNFVAYVLQFVFSDVPKKMLVCSINSALFISQKYVNYFLK